ncbi:MAG TPA: hypothetical protein VLH87_02975 [Pyrinomonadaceae bacterium]|nr:hypothetical protein [Pyrinomonadaceae bacterium]
MAPWIFSVAPPAALTVELASPLPHLKTLATATNPKKQVEVSTTPMSILDQSPAEAASRMFDPAKVGARKSKRVRSPSAAKLRMKLAPPWSPAARILQATLAPVMAPRLVAPAAAETPPSASITR